MFGLYQVENPANRASQMMDGAKSSFAAMGRNGSSTTKRDLPGPTAGGAVSAGLGGAMAGAELTKTLSAMGAKSAAAGGAATAAGGAATAEAVTAGTTAAVEGASVGAAAGAATATGATVAETTAAGSSFGPWGAGIGALVGIGAYLFS